MVGAHKEVYMLTLMHRRVSVSVATEFPFASFGVEGRELPRKTIRDSTCDVCSPVVARACCSATLFYLFLQADTLMIRLLWELCD